ncbi:MAG: ABC transporter permease [Planctomycetota bacterium]|nr:ABC transporter permease [Planctomycetota bacterium]
MTRGDWLPSLRQAGGLLVVLSVLAGVFGWLEPHFLSFATLSLLFSQVPDLAVLACGMTLVMVAGGIDLSVGSLVGLASVVLGLCLVSWQWPLWAAIAASLLVGLLCGLASGLLTVLGRIPSFIVTLGMLEAARGGAYLVSGSQTLYLGARLESISQPLAVINLAPSALLAGLVVLAGQGLLTFTVFGRRLQAVGANERAVWMMGVDPGQVKIITFALCGLGAGLAGVFQAARLGAADPNAGIGMELGAIAAVVIGGASPTGGRGTVLGAFLGVLVIAVLQTGLAQVGAADPVKRLITGGVIVLAVLADSMRRRT